MSVESVYKELKLYLQSILNGRISVNSGSVVADVNLTPQAYIINKNRTLLDYAKALETLNTISALQADDVKISEIASAEGKTVAQVETEISGFIDDFAGNFDMFRTTSKFASDFAWFGRFDLPTINITIAAGTQIKTADNKIYQTTQDAVMTTAGDWYDAEQNLYLIKVPIRSTVSGTIGNCTSFSINTLISQVSGITYVLNKNNITNGIDDESDANFILRIKNKLSGINIHSSNGIKNLIQDNFPTIKDVLVVGPNDALMLRDNGVGGKTDIWILEETEPLNITNESHSGLDVKHNGCYGIYFYNQPANEDDTDFAASNAGGALTPVFTKDVTTNLAGSQFERSYVYFIVQPALPVKLTYSYYSISKQVFDFIKQNQYAILGSITGSVSPIDCSILVRKALQRFLNITFTLYVLTTYDKTVVSANVNTAIGNFVNSFLLGYQEDYDRISQTDISGVAEAVEGVDYLDWTGGVFDLDDTGLETTLTLEDNEYVRTGTITIL